MIIFTILRNYDVIVVSHLTSADTILLVCTVTFSFLLINLIVSIFRSDLRKQTGYADDARVAESFVNSHTATTGVTDYVEAVGDRAMDSLFQLG